MSPEFARAIDPVFLEVVDVLDQIAANQPQDVQQVHTRLRTQVWLAEDNVQASVPREVWDLARYAICAWIDDVLITRHWEGQHWWENHKLEFHFFNTNEAGTAFFQKARQSEQVAQGDALEVFYIAVILGFRGLYALQESTFLAQQYGLPPTIEEWARRTAAMLQNRSQRPGLTGVTDPVHGAPPLESRFTVVGASLVMLMLLVLTGLLGYHILADIG